MAMKICKDCGEEISKDAKVCPKCGKEQRNFFQKHIIITIILVLFILGVIASAGTTTSSNNNANGTSPSSATSVSQSTEKFTLVSHQMTGNEFSNYIEGEIKNNTDKQYTYVQVTFILYDENGAQLGTAMDNINNLEANGTWKYKAVALTTENVASYKLSEITGW